MIIEERLTCDKLKELVLDHVHGIDVGRAAALANDDDALFTYLGGVAANHDFGFPSLARVEVLVQTGAHTCGVQVHAPDGTFAVSPAEAFKLAALLCEGAALIGRTYGQTPEKAIDELATRLMSLRARR